MPLSMMLRIHCLQQWFDLSDPGAEDALYEIESMRRFTGIELGETPVPDETTILNFRRLLEAHQLTAVFMSTINDGLEDKGLLLKGGIMADATLIHAAPSTKNRDKSRDPEMHQTKKGNQWYFGMKIHVGADVDSGVVHTVSVTPANVADITELPNLLREDDRAVFGDAGYVNDHYKRAARRAGVYWGVELKARPKSRLGSSQKRRNRKHSSIRSRVEHLFRVIKCQFGHTRVRYKGLAKNAAQVFMLVGLANLISSERSSWHDGSNPSAAWGNPQKGSKYLGLMSQNPNFSNR
jgi:IS5 family transposase